MIAIPPRMQDGDSALLIAAAGGDMDIAVALIGAKANVDLQDTVGLWY